MKANPSKFQSMLISRNDYCTVNLNINDTIIESSKCVKLLGVLIDDKLSFNNHVSHIWKKVRKQINALCRISCHLDEKALINIYNAFILTDFNYATTVWHLCGKNNMR